MRPGKRALKILFDTYWCPNGWRSAGTLDWTPTTPAADFDYAIEAGAMFPPCVLRHDDVMRRLGTLRAEIRPRDVGDAFVASLSSKLPSLRSALGSFAVMQHLPFHSYKLPVGWCGICGAADDKTAQDLSLLSFERHKWGGVRHENPLYAAFDLERVRVEEGDPPSTEDRARLVELVATIESMAQ